MGDSTKTEKREFEVPWSIVVWVTYLRLVDGRGLHGVEVPA